MTSTDRRARIPTCRHGAIHVGLLLSPDIGRRSVRGTSTLCLNSSLWRKQSHPIDGPTSDSLVHARKVFAADLEEPL